MKKLLLVTTALLALSVLPAKATVTLDTNLSGTGDNVIFESVNGFVAVGSFNGQHTGFVDFTDLSTGISGFTGASNGNDIKITNTADLNIQVFDANGIAVGTTTQVFSLKGTGTGTFLVSAVDANGNPETVQSFDFGPLSLSAQSGFTLTATNGEIITSVEIVDQTGVISEFEHFRIDVAALPTVTAVPEASTWAMMLLGFLGIGLMGMRGRVGSRPFRMISA
jgi:hypothetical protein